MPLQTDMLGESMFLGSHIVHPFIRSDIVTMISREWLAQF